MFQDRSFPQDKVTVAELPEGGYCLKFERDNGFFSQIGHYATWENAIRIAQLNGYLVELDACQESRQLIFAFAENELSLA